MLRGCLASLALLRMARWLPGGRLASLGGCLWFVWWLSCFSAGISLVWVGKGGVWSGGCLVVVWLVWAVAVWLLWVVTWGSSGLSGGGLVVVCGVLLWRIVWWLSWGCLASRCLAYLVVAWMLPGGCLVRRHLRELPESCPSTQRVVRELFLEPATHLPLPTRAFLSVFPWPLLVWMVSGRLLPCFSGVA